MINQRIILGLGPGQCGLQLLTEILGKQRDSKFTYHEAPLLPWQRRPALPSMAERIARWRKSRSQRFIGDVAAFYLPYVEDTLACEPNARLICLQRPREEIVERYCRHLDKVCPFPTNHWALRPASGWYHDPLWTQTFPQYDTQDRREGIGLYWDEYFARVTEFERQYPEQFRIFDADDLTAVDGVRRVLAFAGFPAEGLELFIGKRRELETDAPQAARTAADPLDPRTCAVLVPFTGFIHQECEEGLKELERRGYRVRRVAGFSAIDQGRNQMATDALLEGFEETLWIDSDIGFSADDVERLRRHREPIVCGIYPQKGRRALACHVVPGAPRMTFGRDGGLAELLYAGTGFLLVRREVYLTIQRQLQLPICNERFGHPMIPFFHPMIRPIDDGHWYLAEDYSFCERARQCGFRIVADTSIRLWHIGTCRYGWEDAGMERPRFATFTLNFTGAAEKHDSPTGNEALANFAANYPWPAGRPDVPPPPDRNWLFPATRRVLTDTVPKDARLIVEVGSWLGRSTRFLAGLAPQAHVVAIDHWKGSPEHLQDSQLAEFLPRLYETFLAESWDFRDRIIPVRARSTEGLRLAADAGLKPDLVYLDADHSIESVRADLTEAIDHFPSARIVGDDWDWPSVREAVESVARERRLTLEVFETAWRILPSLKRGE